MISSSIEFGNTILPVWEGTLYETCHCAGSQSQACRFYASLPATQHFSPIPGSTHATFPADSPLYNFVTIISCMRHSFLACAIRASLTKSNPLFTPQFNRLTHIYIYTQTRAYHHDEHDMARDKDKGGGITLKVPKGTRDWQGSDIVLREKVFATITEVFKFVRSALVMVKC
jgi:hypothetical protein